MSVPQGIEIAAVVAVAVVGAWPGRWCFWHRWSKVLLCAGLAAGAIALFAPGTSVSAAAAAAVVGCWAWDLPIGGPRRAGVGRVMAWLVLAAALALLSMGWSAAQGGAPRVVGALVLGGLLAVDLFQSLLDRVARDPSDGLVARLVRWRLGGWPQAVVVPDPTLPERPSRPVRALVVGGGLAGLGAAIALAERGVSVTVRERAPWLGGKVAAWPVTLKDGTTVTAEHGFHAFFRQYWNQRALFHRLGITRGWRSIGDYLILTRDGRRVSFAGTSPAPILNLIDLARIGVYSLLPVAMGRAGPYLEEMLRYDPETTYRSWDGVSFKAFAEKAGLPPALMLVFTTFSRAFFADADRMSTAELFKSFHFFYLSNDRGLVYDHPADDADRAVIAPLAAHLTGLGAELRTGAPVERLTRRPEGGFLVDGEAFDHVVVAADVPGTRALLAGLPPEEAPALADALAHLSAGQRYAVLTLWLDRPVGFEGPAFVITERERALDALTFPTRVRTAAAQWARDTGGGIVELHCYAAPDALSDEDLRDALLADLAQVLPEAASAGVLGEHWMVRRDFPAFHVGAWARRPESRTDLPGLWLAGDWVKLPWPAMLMEAAQTSALVAANGVLAAEGVRGHPIWAAPPRGILAGVPRHGAAPTV